MPSPRAQYRFSICKRCQPQGVPDPDVPALAAAEERILLSYDFKTMPWHFGDFLQARGSSPGLILVPQHMPIGEVIEELALIWGASEAEEWKDRWRALPLPYTTRWNVSDVAPRPAGETDET